MLLSQQFCVLLFDLCTASSLFSSQNWAGSQSHLISWGKRTPKSESRAASWRRYQGRQIRSLQGDRRKKNLAQKWRALGDRGPAAQLKTIPTASSHCTECGTSLVLLPQLSKGRKDSLLCSCKPWVKGLVIQSVQVLADRILSHRKMSCISGNF